MSEGKKRLTRREFLKFAGLAAASPITRGLDNLFYLNDPNTTGSLEIKAMQERERVAIGGYVEDGEQRKLPGYPIAIFRKDTEELVGTVVTNSDGEMKGWYFLPEDLGPGEYLLQIRPTSEQLPHIKNINLVDPINDSELVEVDKAPSAIPELGPCYRVEVVDN